MNTQKQTEQKIKKMAINLMKMGKTQEQAIEQITKDLCKSGFYTPALVYYSITGKYL
jgi:mannitol/fructose-specific phosphotransferase system IIA component (Ntr-type)